MLCQWPPLSLLAETVVSVNKIVAAVVNCWLPHAALLLLLLQLHMHMTYS